MMRIAFYIFAFTSLAFTYFLHQFWPPAIYILYILIPIVIIGVYDVLSVKHTVLRNYPVLGHLRYVLEYIRPEIQQYFIATDHSEAPFTREIRSIIYQRSKNVNDTVPFGTKQKLTEPGYEFFDQSIMPTKFITEQLRVEVGGPQCKKPYSASILNVSAMSFGALSSAAILALNKGAKKGNFYHNTGEGGLSRYHNEGGGDLVWQIGTSYFGCRTKDGNFDPHKFKKQACQDNVKMIEIKISQGAKPSHGGVLPKAKISPEIAEVRGISREYDCVSPPYHKEFSTPIGLLKFVERLRELSEGKPIGLKMCIGKPEEFMAICKAMVKTKILPDFITIDGSEGGTGAAPLEFTSRLGKTLDESLILVHNCLTGIGVRDKIKIIGSGKIATGFNIASKLCIGADICNCARPMMFALGCIQSLNCNTNRCPTGIATQNKFRARGLNVEDKHIRVYYFHKNTIRSFKELVEALGVDNISRLTPELLHKRETNGNSKTYKELYTYIKNGCLLKKKYSAPEPYAHLWRISSAEKF